MALKRMSNDKTVIAELKLTLADQNTRNRLITESIAARVSGATGLKQGDATVTQTESIVLENINTMVFIHSWGPMVLKTMDANSVVQQFPCSGLYLLYGQLRSVEIKAALAEQLRISYIYA